MYLTLIVKFINQITLIDQKDIIDLKLDDLRKSLLEEIKKSFSLKCDNIHYSNETNYILRNEKEIIEKILNQTNQKNNKL